MLTHKYLAPIRLKHVMGKTRVAAMEQVLLARFFRTRKTVQPYPLAYASRSTWLSKRQSLVSKIVHMSLHHRVGNLIESRLKSYLEIYHKLF